MAQTIEGIFYQGMDQGRLDYTPSDAVANGEIIDLGSGLAGICTSPEGIAANTLGSMATKGIFKIKKAVSGGVTFTRGDIVQWDGSGNTAVTVSGTFKLGICVADAADADEFVLTEINREQVD